MLLNDNKDSLCNVQLFGACFSLKCLRGQTFSKIKRLGAKYRRVPLLLQSHDLSKQRWNGFDISLGLTVLRESEF